MPRLLVSEFLRIELGLRRVDSLRNTALFRGNSRDGADVGPPDLGRLTELAALLFRMPYAAVTLIKGESHTFRIVVGFDAVELRPQELAFETTSAQHPLVVYDGSLDSRFANEPLIVSAPHVRFYAGVRLVDSNGDVLGTLAVMDNVAREVSSKEVEGLATLGTQVALHLEAQRSRDNEADLAAAIVTAAINLTLPDDSEFGPEHAVARMGSWKVALRSAQVDWSGDAQTLSAVKHLKQGQIELAPCNAYEWRARARQLFVLCARLGTAFDEEICIVNAVGTMRWVRSAAEAVRDDRGHITHVRGTFQDITDRRKAQAEALRIERQLAVTLDSITDAFFAVDNEWRLTHVNKEFERLLLRGRHDVLGKVLWDEFKESVGTPFDTNLRRAVASKHAVVFEELYVTLDCWFEVRVFPSEEGLAVYFRDVTARRKADALHRALEMQLRHAQQMESLGTLAGGIAHDFNNILAVILGNLEIVRTDVGLGHVAQEALQHIEHAACSARDLVRRILAFSRRQPEQQMRTQLLPPLVRHAVGLLRTTLPSGIELTTDITDEALAVTADSTLVEQVVMNLCINAWHAMPQGRGSITVGLTALTLNMGEAASLAPIPQGQVAHLWVSDNGCGMSEDTQARVLEPFFTTKSAGQGTGLGMSVVNGIILAHKGAIRIESVLGKGSTIHVYFPAQPECDIASDVALGASEPVPPAGEGQHVLFVDDDEVLRLTFKCLLERDGYRVTTCSDAAEAMKTLRAQPEEFALLVTDYDMPGGTGLDLAKDVGQLNGQLSVVIASGYISEELRRDAASAGIAGLIQKEDAFQQLGKLVGKLLLERSAAAQQLKGELASPQS